MAQSEDYTPLVAVVTPVYNGASFLDETMACVQAQTYQRLVHCVLDNASSDATPAIINRYIGGRVPILTRCNPETISLRANWEAAVRMTPSDAKYFLVLCADDLMAKDAIAKLVEVAESDSAIAATGCLWVIGAEQHSVTEPCGLPDGISVFDGRWFVKTYLLKLHFATSPQCTLFRRDLLSEKAPFFANDEMLMDVDACLRSVVNAKYGLVHSALGFTRMHSERVTCRLDAPAAQFAANWLAFIDRYGPGVMSARELNICRRAFLRHYFRRLLFWRFWNRDKVLFDLQLKILAAKGVKPSAWDFAYALIHWIWLKLRDRRADVGAASSLWTEAWAELEKMESGKTIGGPYKHLRRPWMHELYL